MTDNIVFLPTRRPTPLGVLSHLGDNGACDRPRSGYDSVGGHGGEKARRLHIDGQPLDYAEQVRFVPNATPVSFGERMVLFFTLNGEALSFWFAMASIALLVGVVGGAFLAGAWS